MGSGDKPKLASCTPDDVFRALKKLGGFKFKNGAKHTKVIHIASSKTSTIPRQARVNRHLLRDFVEDYLVKDVGLKEDDIYKHLWC